MEYSKYQGGKSKAMKLNIKCQFLDLRISTYYAHHEVYTKIKLKRLDENKDEWQF